MYETVKMLLMSASSINQTVNVLNELKNSKNPEKVMALLNYSDAFNSFEKLVIEHYNFELSKKN